MLRFFREKKDLVVWGIVLFFAGTMFTGSLFYGALSNKQTTESSSQTKDDAVAIMGDLSVPTSFYYRNVNRYMSDPSVIEDGSPEIMEDVLFEALSRSVEEVVFLGLANESNIEVERIELEGEEEKVVLQLGLKNRKELKSLIKERGKSYASFKEELEDSIKIQKFIGLIEQQVAISDKDVEHKYSEIKVKQILFRGGDITDEELDSKANDVYVQLTNGLSFDEAVQLYSDDSRTKEKGGSLGWVRFSKVLPEFEDVAFNLSKGEISKPFKTPVGIHIVMLEDKRYLPKPENFDMEREKEELLYGRKEYEKSKIVQRFLSKNPLVIQDPMLIPIEAKRRRDFEAAKNGYYSLSSLNPRSPIPNYHLAKLYFLLNDKEEGYRQLTIAETKIEFAPDLDFPEFHFLFAQYYKEKKDIPNVLVHYDAALELSKDSIYKLEFLKREMKALNDTKRVDKIDDVIIDLNQRLEAQQALESAEQESTFDGDVFTSNLDNEE